METLITLILIAGILLIPLLPAFIIYKYLPSETVVNGPFKGLNINLTGAFSGYFLLVIISVGLIYSWNDSELGKSKTEIEKLTLKINELNNDISKEKAKYQPWKMLGNLESKSPEATKIFVDEENISINSTGRFSASLLLMCDERQNAQVPSAICFFNKDEGYSVIDLREVNQAKIDTSSKQIEIKEKIKLNIPVKYIHEGNQYP